MKKIIHSIAIIAILGFATGVRAQEDFEQNMYVTYEVGGVFQQASTMRLGPGGSAGVSYYPGARADVGLGYNFNSWLAANVSGGFMWNSINNFAGVPLHTSGQDVNIYSFPILAGATLKLPNRTHFVPFLGIAGGANISEFFLNGGGTTGNDHDVEPAVQVQAGVNYAINESASLGVDYKFMATRDQSYQITGNNITLSGIYIHGIFAILSINF